jgi:hypothetical protein
MARRQKSENKPVRNKTISEAEIFFQEELYREEEESLTAEEFWEKENGGAEKSPPTIFILQTPNGALSITNGIRILDIRRLAHALQDEELSSKVLRSRYPEQYVNAPNALRYLPSIAEHLKSEKKLALIGKRSQVKEFVKAVRGEVEDVVTVVV